MTPVSRPGPASTGAPGTEIVRRPVTPLRRWAPPPRRAAARRTWAVGRNGAIELVEGLWAWPVAVPAPGPPTGQLIRARRRRVRRPVAELTAGPVTGPGRRGTGRAFAGLAAAMVTVGLGLLVAAATGPSPAPTVAAGTSDAPIEELQIVPPGPATDFVYPIIPAVPPQMPVGLVDPGLVDGGLAYPGLVPPPVPPPPPPVPTATTTPATVPTTAGAEGRGDTGAAPLQGSATPKPTQSSTATPTSAVPPAPSPPDRVQLPGSPGIETLVPVGPADGDLPDALPGAGVGLWSGGTGEAAVLVLGADHPAVAALRAPGPPAGRWIVVEHEDGSTRGYLLDEHVVLPRDEAVALLSDNSAPLVIVVAVADDMVTLVEAR